MSRPIGVWIIGIYAVLNAAVGLFLLIAVSPPWRVTNFALPVLVFILFAAAGVALLMLRRLALPLFVVTAAFSLANEIFPSIPGYGVKWPPAPGLVLAWLITLTVIAYTVHLWRRGVLS